MIVLFGLAGSGKSLQGEILANKYGWRWMSIGQLLRDCNDPVMNETMKRGELVPDEFVVKLMHGEMMKEAEAGRNAILDGYPRDKWQADWIVENGDDKYIDGAIIFDVSREELLHRLELRGRVDDTRESIERRWAIIEQNIYSMIERLEGAGVKIAHVDGEGAIEEVTQRLENILRGWGTINTQDKQGE
ncbi:nucleoside monophosphate kinase [Candidatus Saccharibacteria bacterium]|nr:nucleoside monophosphate kinase [Candidatus Saccharibacteria bacterium]